MKEIELYSRIMVLPENLKKETDDFVDFLKSKMEKESSDRPKKAGLAKGLIEIEDDFDKPLDEFDEYM